MALCMYACSRNCNANLPQSLLVLKDHECEGGRKFLVERVYVVFFSLYMF